jgi:uncharacterized BrkB/YihY/UPF0761 family membrane protein
MNIDLLKGNPPWWWYLVFMFGTLSVTMFVWIIFKRFPDVNRLRDPLLCLGGSIG